MKIKRLIKKSDGGGDYPIGIILKNPYEQVDFKDELSDITYGPSINQEWKFDKPIDNMEWRLQQSVKKR